MEHALLNSVSLGKGWFKIGPMGWVLSEKVYREAAGKCFIMITDGKISPSSFFRTCSVLEFLWNHSGHLVPNLRTNSVQRGRQAQGTATCRQAPAEPSWVCTRLLSLWISSQLHASLFFNNKSKFSAIFYQNHSKRFKDDSEVTAYILSSKYRTQRELWMKTEHGTRPMSTAWILEKAETRGKWPKKSSTKCHCDSYHNKIVHLCNSKLLTLWVMAPHRAP